MAYSLDGGTNQVTGAGRNCVEYRISGHYRGFDVFRDGAWIGTGPVTGWRTEAQAADFAVREAQKRGDMPYRIVYGG